VASAAPLGRDATPTVALVSRPLATNYVIGVFHGPAASDPDAPAFRLATAFFSSRLNYAVREQRGLSYAAYAPYFDRGATAGGLYVTTTAPAAALALARAQLDSLRRDSYPLALMRYFTQQFVTDYIGSNMTSADQADALARAQLYLGDYRRATREMEALRDVSGSDIRRVARRYLAGAHFVYVGDTTRVARSAFADF
jgi:predicted Zn-dependent peptidase